MLNITIKLDNIDRKILNILFYITCIILILLNLFIITIKPIIVLLTLTISIIFMYIFYNFINRYKIEINNNTITKTNIFNIKKLVANLNEITGYTMVNNNINVLKDDKVLFSFRNANILDNKELYNYLTKNFEHKIHMIGNKLDGTIYLTLGITFLLVQIISNELNLIISLLSMLLIFLGINEHIKKLAIINDEIIYQKLFINKKFNINNLTKITYQKHIQKYRGFTNIYYTINGYNNDLKLFNISKVKTESIPLLKKYCKEKNIIIKKEG